jgi:hypothetical protein
MLVVAEHWLQRELDENRRQYIAETAVGASDNPELYDPTSQGGYCSGQLGKVDTTTSTTNGTRAGRLSDMMGNSGSLERVYRAAAKTTTTTSSKIPNK